MAITVEEFINPKSMITPGAAAAIVATAAGAFFSLFGIVLQVSLIVLSLFVGVIVFHSKEFADPEMTKWAKGFFYILNSIIIFAMATGTHAVFDKTARSAIASISFIRPVYAQEKQPSDPSLKQKRPFFYDWTKGDHVPKSTGSEDVGIVKSTVNKDFGKLKGLFVAAGIATPDYKVQVEIDKSKVPGHVMSVTWDLPKAYFAQDKVTTTDKSKNFKLNIQAWNPFEIGAEIELASGEKLRLEKVITFDAIKE